VTSGVTVPSGFTATLNGSGSTFQLAYQQQAAQDVKKTIPGLTVNYGGGGSGKGRTDLAGNIVNFAGSDSPIPAADQSKFNGTVLYFPLLLGPITVSYNVSGLDKLQLSADTIAGIFMAKITKWNDPAIAADNPGASLPSTSITVVHRSDGSGTTQNFTQYLMTTAASTWTLGSGSTVNWPAGTQAGNGNGGVATAIKQTNGAVGYVDLSDASAAGLKFASVKNSSGSYIAPTPESASAAGSTVTLNPDLTFSALNSSAPTAYPITYQTWVLVYEKQSSSNTAQALQAYISYLLTTGQASLPDLDYAPLPANIQAPAVAQLSKITAG
jgi:phosphate transport system substrate-binding protein